MDLISREAVLKHQFTAYIENMWHMTEDVRVVETADIKELPSAFEGMSNGNVIQAVLGLKDEQIDFGTYSVYLYPIGLVGCKPFATISRDWWNAPYKGVSE